MLESLAELLQATALSQGLRSSIWLYPLVNTGHILGIALLFGAIVPIDLRLLGCWPRIPFETLAEVLIPVAICGVLVAIATGALLFATRPLDYIAEPLFGIKLALVAIAILNALAVRGLPRSPMPARWRFAALASILLWIAVITVGRMIGYR